MTRLKALLCIIIMAMVMVIAGFAYITIPVKKNFGVFLSVTENLDSLADYETVVVDAQYFSKEEIDAFKKKGHKVYSYINVGSLENFRSYYDEFKNLSLGEYENWEEECWIDVSNVRWQSFITARLAPSLLEKDIDGFFVDNLDVYYYFPNDNIYSSLVKITKDFVSTGKTVIINGGDVFIDAYCKKGGSCKDIMTAICQESVFSQINWDDGSFKRAPAEVREYFQDYIERYAALGVDIYLIEYTTDKKLISEISRYCRQNDFEYYIADSIELE